MDKIIESILELIPFGYLFELIGLSKELSAGLSVLVAAILLYIIGIFIKKLQTYIKNKNTAADLNPYFSYLNVKKSTELFIQTRGQNHSPTSEEEPRKSTRFIVKEKLIPWFLKSAFNEKQESDKYYLILADSGMGKTTFMINLYIRYISKFCQKYTIKLIPFGDERIIGKLKELGKNQDQAKNTILLLDAFDEYKGLLPPDEPDGLDDDERFRKQIDEIVKLTRDFREVVITSRTQYFPGQENEPYELKIRRFDDQGFHTLAKLYLSPFDSNEIRKYLNKKYGVLKFWNNKKKQLAKRIVEASPKLMVRPMLLAYIDYLVDSKEKFETTYQIYETLIEKWIEREAKKRKNESTTRDKFRKDLYEFSMQISLTIYKNQKSTKELSIDKQTATALCNTENLNLKDYEVTGQSLLTRDANHNWKFAHKSILEFFLAKQCLANSDFLDEFEFSGMDMVETFHQEVIGKDFVFVKGGMLNLNDKKVINIPGFYICKYQVTQKQWQEIMGKDPSNFKGENNPVENVSWNDVQGYIKKINAKTGNFFRLPSEAEWEYAARGGNRSKGFEFAGSNNLDEVGWCKENSNNSTHPVGQKIPNELGIYDMSGNVWEWCQDKWSDGYDGIPKDGRTNETGKGSIRFNRGGSWDYGADDCRVAGRISDDAGSSGDDMGFRLALSL